GSDSRVGEDDVDRSELGDTLVEDSLQCLDVTNIDLPGDDPPALRLHLLHGLFQVLRAGHRVGDRVELRAYVDGDDVGTFLRQPNGVAATLAARCSRDERNLSG